MHSRRGKALVAVCLGWAVGLAAVSAAFADDEDRRRDEARVYGNVRVRIEVGRMDAGKKASVSSYVFITSADGATRQQMFGSKVPIPTTTFPSQDGSGKVQPVSSFTYQEVGTTTKIRVTGVDADHIRVNGTIEGNLLRRDEGRGASTTPPTMGNLYQDVGMLLKSGVPMRIVGVDQPGEGSVYVEVEATYLE